MKQCSIVAQDAVRVAAGWLSERLPDRFGPADPTFDVKNQLWRVPVMLAYPGLTVGQVGEIVVDASSGEVVRHTDVDEITTAGLKLGRKHRAKVRAAFLRARTPDSCLPLEQCVKAKRSQPIIT